MDAQTLKRRARTLVTFFKSRNVPLKYQTALDAVSVLETGRDFNVVSKHPEAEPPVQSKAAANEHVKVEGQCNCQLCQQNRVFVEKVSALPEEQRGYFEMIYDDLLEKDMDNDYYRAIMTGAWPSSVEILERALARAKEKVQTARDAEAA